VDELLKAVITSATRRHAQGVNPVSKNQPTQPEHEDQEHRFGADDAATSIISAKENTKAKG
jgi:hypothetical protein